MHRLTKLYHRAIISEAEYRQQLVWLRQDLNAKLAHCVKRIETAVVAGDRTMQEDHEKEIESIKKELDELPDFVSA